MKPTTWRLLLPLFIVAGSSGWSLARLIHHWTDQLTVVGWSMPITMGILAVALAIWTLLVRPRLLRKPGHVPLPPLTAARTAALALAASRAGIIIAGIHAGIVAVVLPLRDAPNGRAELLIALVACGCSLAFSGVGWWLEILCRIRGDKDDDGPKAVRRRPGERPAGSAARSHIG